MSRSGSSAMTPAIAPTCAAPAGGSFPSSTSGGRLGFASVLVNRSTVATVALALLLVAGMAPFIDMDVWHQMSLFREALRQGWIPYIDRFAYTPTLSPAVQHEWGAGAIAYLAATCFGETGLQLLRLSLVLAIAVVGVRVAL